MEEIQSPQCAPGVLRSSGLSISNTNLKQRNNSLIKSVYESRSKSRNSGGLFKSQIQTAEFKTTIPRIGSNPFLLSSGRNPNDRATETLDKTTINPLTKIPQNPIQVFNLYAKKSSDSICHTLLQNINSQEVCNKNEHLIQFFSLYQSQSFRMKTDLRLKLFMGNSIQSRSQQTELDAFLQDQQQINGNSLNGIIQLIGSFQDDEFNGMMQAENLLKFLHDMLDYNLSPQANVFNILFNNLDIYWVFKMRLPEFIRVNSPYKVHAQKLLHQFIVKKPIDIDEHIALFFSEDASYTNLSPIYKSTYEQFLRYHKL